MQHILEVLDRDIERRKQANKKNYQKFQELEQKIERLTHENQALRNDLFQLSLNHFKNKNNGKEENDTESFECCE